MTARPVVIVIEDAEVLARGLVEFVRAALPGAEVRATPDPDGVSGSPSDLVVCGPSSLGACCGVLGESARPAASLAVVADPARVDFAALLAAGIDVLWDIRGNLPTFASAAAAALAGQPWVSETLTGPMANDIGVQLRRGMQAADYGLTQRESEILQLLATGASNRDIAVRLFISQNTVKNHVRAVLDKLHASTRTEAVMIGARAGLIDVRQSRA